MGKIRISLGPEEVCGRTTIPVSSTVNDELEPGGNKQLIPIKAWKHPQLQYQRGGKLQVVHIHGEGCQVG